VGIKGVDALLGRAKSLFKFILYWSWGTETHEKNFQN
jgi:hypothetical protein